MKTTKSTLNILIIAALLLSNLAWGAAATGAATAEPLDFILYVTQDASVSGTCSAWADPCGLQAALTAAEAGDEIWVAAGTYKPTIPASRTATFLLESGVALYGGFGGSETARGQRNWMANRTILSGDIDGNGVVDTGNAYHVVTGSGTDATAVLDGFTITAGYAWADYSDDYNNYGGGMFIEAGSPTLTGITFSRASKASSPTRSRGTRIVVRGGLARRANEMSSAPITDT